MHKREMRKRLQRLRPGSTDDIRTIISIAEADPNLQILANMARVIANTGIRNGEFAGLRISDIDPTGSWLEVRRPRSTSMPSRVLPIRPRTYMALLALHQLNPESELVLGDFPKTRFNSMLHKLKVVAPNFGRARQRTYSIRANFAFRLMSAGIPAGIVKYVLGWESLESSFQRLPLTPEQRLQIVRRSFECFLDEL